MVSVVAGSGPYPSIEAARRIDQVAPIRSSSVIDHRAAVWPNHLGHSGKRRGDIWYPATAWVGMSWAK